MYYLDFARYKIKGSSEGRSAYSQSAHLLLIAISQEYKSGDWPCSGSMIAHSLA